MLTPPRDPKKLKEYFTARFEVLCALEELHKSGELTVSDAESETPGNK